MTYTWGFFGRVIVKAALLFVAVNALFIATAPLPVLGQLTIHNWLVAGRERLPFGENDAAYNLSLNNVDAMFTSHELSGGKPEDEFRVVLIGDSATWGFLLETPDTLAGQLNRLNLTTTDDRAIRAYNVGYPTMSLTKDFMLLDRAMDYAPDMVIWLFTLESFPRNEQFESPLVANNANVIAPLIEQYGIDVVAPQIDESAIDQSIWGKRRDLADLLRLQMFGVMWQTTRIDQLIPTEYDLRQSDFDENVNWHGMSEPLPDDMLAFDVLTAGVERVGDVPILLVNEPMFISEGENSDLRYNFFYPRWVYDDYRVQLANQVEANNWAFLDLWDVIDPDEFTDSPVHMTPSGTAALADTLQDSILETAR